LHRQHRHALSRRLNGHQHRLAGGQRRREPDQQCFTAKPQLGQSVTRGAEDNTVQRLASLSGKHRQCRRAGGLGTCLGPRRLMLGEKGDAHPLTLPDSR